MALYMIGIGLNDEKDITLKGLEAVKKCERVYLEGYTSRLNAGIERLERLYGKKVMVAGREFVEDGKKIISEAKSADVALLVIGDVFSATTHISLMTEARKQDVGVKVIHNASVLSAIGITGLELYKFGKVTSIPFENKRVEEPVKVLRMNMKNGLHTLFLLDLKPDEDRFMMVSEAADYLIINGADEGLKAVACCQLGSEKPVIKVGKLGEIRDMKLKKLPQCLIIPAKKLHFVEEEALGMHEKAKLL